MNFDFADEKMSLGFTDSGSRSVQTRLGLSDSDLSSVGKQKYNTFDNQKAVSYRLDLELIITSLGPVNWGVVYQLLRFLSFT